MNAAVEPPVKEKQLSLQDGFLQELIKARTPVAIYLINGIKLLGMIDAFDAFTVILSNNGLQQLVYKQVISTVVPGDTQRNVSRGNRDADGDYRKFEGRRGRQPSF